MCGIYDAQILMDRSFTWFAISFSGLFCPFSIQWGVYLLGDGLYTTCYFDVAQKYVYYAFSLLTIDFISLLKSPLCECPPGVSSVSTCPLIVSIVE
jgi:hypothetical protein